MKDRRRYRVIRSVDGTYQPYHDDSLKSSTEGGRCAYSFLPITMPLGICVDFEIIGNVYENPELLDANKTQ
jgi:YopX protein